MSIIDDLFKNSGDDLDTSGISTKEEYVAKLAQHYPASVVTCPQGIVTYVILNKSIAARLLAHVAKEKIEKQIKELLAGNADITEDELRAAMKSYYVWVLSYRRSGSGRSGGDVVVGQIADGDTPDKFDEPYAPGSLGDVIGWGRKKDDD